MSYLALYRKYRPTSFTEVIGQKPIVTALSNAAASGKLAHAYLFSGSRGTGKTSTARILAKAANCLSLQNGSPCGICEACRAIDEGCIDVLEIDAASNNKVDEVRDLREKIKYPPVVLSRKVYIIDEVHMLSDAAFNALLKTLEEPPAHALFILATTEAHKLPATILSRCLKFEFRLVSDQEILDHLKKILTDLNIPYDPSALALLAKNAEGSVRDSLSLADVCASKGGKIDETTVLNAIGAGNFYQTLALGEAILSRDAAKIYTLALELKGGGKGASQCARDQAIFFRNLLAAKVIPDAEKTLKLPLSQIERLKSLAISVSQSHCVRIIEIIAAAESQIRFSLNPFIVFENACLKAALFPDWDEFLIKMRLEKLENKFTALVNSLNNTALNSAPNIKAGEQPPLANPKVESKIEPQPKVESKIEPQPKVESKIQPQPKVESKIQPQPNPNTEPQPKVESKIQPQPNPNTEPQPKVESNIEENAPQSQIVDEDIEIISLTNISDSVVSFDQRALDASMLWGRILTTLRESGRLNLYNLMLSASDESLINAVLSIKCDENTFLQAKPYEQELSYVADQVAKGCSVLLIKREEDQKSLLAKDFARIKKLIYNLKIKK